MRTLARWFTAAMSLMLVTTATAITQASAATSNMLFGQRSLASYQDSNASGSAQAFQYTATSSGTTHDMDLYVSTGSTATKLRLGIYADSGGTPAALVASGGLTSPSAGAWNDVPLTSASITSGRKYWIALLGTGGTLDYRDTSGGSAPSYVNSTSGLASLPSNYSPGKQFAVSPASVYVNAQTSVVSAPAAQPPANTALPLVSGTAQQGQALSTSTGTWTGSPTGYGYQWQDCDSSGAGCAAISAATGSSYTLTASDTGHTVRAVVTATNRAGSATATSTPTQAVTAPSATQNCAGTPGSQTVNQSSLDACGFPSMNTTGPPAGTS